MNRDPHVFPLGDFTVKSTCLLGDRPIDGQHQNRATYRRRLASALAPEEAFRLDFDDQQQNGGRFYVCMKGESFITKPRWRRCSGDARPGGVS